MTLDVDRPRPVPKARQSDPVFTVLDVEPVEHALTPALRFQLHVSDPGGREVYAIALSAQIMVDPARRAYDEPTRERLVELFGAPERWGATTHSFLWAQVDTLVPGFTGATSFALTVPCTYDLEVAAAKYFYSLPDGAAPLSFHFTGMVLFNDGGLRVTPVPWACSARWAMPVEAWQRTMASTYPGGGWIRLSTETLDALSALKATQGDHSFDTTVRGLLEVKRDRLEELLTTLVWEGYQLYPYTPGTTKNATPTPFGIVYPPAYADGSPHRFARSRLQGIVEGDFSSVRGEVRFLRGGEEARLEPDGDQVTLEVEDFGDLARVTLTVYNRTEVPEGLTRSEALEHSLLSTHLVLYADDGRFLSLISPPEHAAAACMACAAVNTFPVLACDEDTALLGATIMLPDHPELAPESRGDLFDGTEIEEALMLHVLALSDGEREQITDPAVKAMLERAIAATPEDIIGLHGRTTMGDDVVKMRGVGEAGEAGAPEATVGGITYRPGARVRVVTGAGTAHDHLYAGRNATVERVYIDYEDGVHLGLTIDDDPGAELMRDIGRYLYFKPDDVEVLDAGV